MVDSFHWASKRLQHLTWDSSADMGFAKTNPLSSHYDNWKSYSGECKHKSQASIQSMLPIEMNQNAALIVAEIAF